MRTLFASVAAAALIGGSAMAQHVVLVPQGQGPAGMQQFILVPIPQDQAEQGGQQQGAGQQGTGQQGTGQQGAGQQGAGQQGAGQQGAGQQGAGQQGAGQQGGQQAGQQQMRDRAEAMAMDLYRRGYQRGVADAQSAAGPQLDPGAMEQIGRELFERGYMLGLMQGRSQAGQQQAGSAQQGQSEQQPQAGEQTAQAQTGQQTAGQQATGPQGTGQQGTEQATGQQGGQSGHQLVEGQVGATAQADMPDAMIGTKESQQYGQYLVDENGSAVYMFTADKQGQGDAQNAVSNCQDDCAAAWPPVLSQSESAQAMGAAKSDLIGTIERQDGTTQVTYNGWPLYYYVKDQGEAQVTGQDVHGFGGEWYLLTPEGEKVEG